MKRLIRTAAVLAVLLSLTTARSSSAAAMSWGVDAFGAFNTHTLGDWNDIIDAANAGGSNFDNITSGFSFGAGPCVMVGGQWLLGVHYERLMPKKSEDGTTEIKLGANAFGLSGMYMLPSKGAMSLGLGASIDYMTLASKIEDPTFTPSENKVEGSGVGFQLLAQAGHSFSPTFSGSLTAGYRIAKISIDTIGGMDATGSGLEDEDYSGLVLRLGIAVHQPMSK